MFSPAGKACRREQCFCRRGADDSGTTTACDERMSHGGLWLDSLFRIPCETLGDEIYKVLVVAPEDLGKRFCSRSPSFTFRVDDWSRSTMVI